MDAEATKSIVSEEKGYRILTIPFSTHLEMSDPLHRYGPDLMQLYEENKLDNIDSFLAFLKKKEIRDIPRVNYIDPYLLDEFCCVFTSKGGLKWRQSDEEVKSGRYIFVMTTEGEIYCAIKEKESEPWFLHSSLGAYLNIAGAGKFVVGNDGIIERIINSSGHYTPTDLGMYQVLSELNKQKKIWLSLVVVLLEDNSWRYYRAIDWFGSRQDKH